MVDARRETLLKGPISSEGSVPPWALSMSAIPKGYLQRDEHEVQ